MSYICDVLSAFLHNNPTFYVHPLNVTSLEYLLRNPIGHKLGTLESVNRQLPARTLSLYNA